MQLASLSTNDASYKVLMNYPHIFLGKENEQAAGRLPGSHGFAFQC